MSEEFARVIVTRDIRFKHAKGMRDIYGKELHVYHEIFFFIAGDAEFVSELGTRKLSPFTTVIIPKDNERDLEEIDQTVRSALNFVTAQTVDTVLNTALNRQVESYQPLYNNLPGDLKPKSRGTRIRQ